MMIINHYIIQNYLYIKACFWTVILTRARLTVVCSNKSQTMTRISIKRVKSITVALRVYEVCQPTLGAKG